MAASGDQEVRRYPRGFVGYRRDIVGDVDSSPVPGSFLPIEFDGWTVWVDRSARYGMSENATVRILVIGIAAFVSPARSDLESTVDPDGVAELLGNAFAEAFDRFLDMLDYTAGRFAVVVETSGGQIQVFHDAHGTRSVYYSTETPAFASHANLLSEVLGLVDRNQRELKERTSWAALPLSFSWDETKYETIRALLPNHLLGADEGNTQRYFPRSRNPYADWDSEERLTEIARLWNKQIELLNSITDRFIVSVSGGLDSRVVFAGVRDYQGKVDAFTYYSSKGGSKWARTLQLDRDLAEQVLANSSVRHLELDRSADVLLSAEQDRVVDGNSLVRHGRWLVAHYLREFGETQNLHLRGNLQETMRLYYGRKPNRDPLDLIGAIVAGNLSDSQFSDDDRTRYSAKLVQTLDEFGYAGGLFGYDPSDFFYWENRMGRWISEVYNETDAAFDTISPVNMRAIVQMGLAYPLEDRRQGVVFRDLIDLFWPELNFFGINSRSNLYQQWRDCRAKGAELSAKAAVVPPWLGRPVVESDDAFASAPLLVEASGQEIFAVSPREYSFPEELISEGAFVGRTVVWGNSSPDDLDKNNSLDRSSGVDDVYLFKLRNTYLNPRGTNYLRFEVRVNGEFVVGHRLGVDGRDSYWAIYGLKEGDQLTLGVRSLRNARAASWARASRCMVTRFIPPSEYWSRRPDIGLGFTSTSASTVLKSDV